MIKRVQPKLKNWKLIIYFATRVYMKQANLALLGDLKKVQTFLFPDSSLPGREMTFTPHKSILHPSRGPQRA